MWREVRVVSSEQRESTNAEEEQQQGSQGLAGVSPPQATLERDPVPAVLLALGDLSHSHALLVKFHL